MERNQKKQDEKKTTSNMGEDKFFDKMSDFSEMATPEFERLQERHVKMEKEFKRQLGYFQLDSKLATEEYFEIFEKFKTEFLEAEEKWEQRQIMEEKQRKRDQ